MKRILKPCFLFLMIISVNFLAAFQVAAQSLESSAIKDHQSNASSEKKDLAILDKWSGDYPVDKLECLPLGQQEVRVGYISDKLIFSDVWKAFKPAEPVPEIDFGKNMVIFSRNVQFYNRLNIFRIIIDNGVAEVLAMETMSAMPIEDKVAMAMAVVSRSEIRFLQTGQMKLLVHP
ncbi:MAG: hypothetical protein HF978_03440 [Desulfobacteraceae bacterium]|nr:hypothetical protein [Desulfobacteraceae bacterium]MBC2754579.1 hypothetical protein [Desulfobacteraceae bacterium]